MKSNTTPLTILAVIISAPLLSAQCLGPGDPTSISSNIAFSGTGTIRDTSTNSPHNGGASFNGTYRYTGASVRTNTWNTTNHGINTGQTWDTTVNFNPVGGLAEFTTHVGNYNRTSWAWTDNVSGNSFSIAITQRNAGDPTLQFIWDDGTTQSTVDVASFANGQSESLTFQFAPSATADSFDITWSSTGSLLNGAYASTYTHTDAVLASATDISHAYSTLSQAAWYEEVDPVTGARSTVIRNASLGIQGFADPNDPGEVTSSYGPCPVPEPSSSLLMLLGASFFTLKRRR